MCLIIVINWNTVLERRVGGVVVVASSIFDLI
jgi:hypothetical protein